MTVQMDFAHIRAYWYLMGMQDYHIDEYVATARREGAPADAIYKDPEGAWVTSKACTEVMMEQMREVMK